MTEEGDWGRLRTILEEAYASLYRYARALSGDASEAEDLVQEACKRALAAPNKPSPLTAGRTRAWLFRIVRNIWLNEIRRRSRRAESELPEEASLESAAPAPDALLARKLLQYEVRQAIDSLPESFREVLVLRELEDLSYDQIAEILDCPAGTVMSRLARARSRLRLSLRRSLRASQGTSR